MPVYDEGMLRFNFGPPWADADVTKFDDHNFYRKRVETALQRTKAVDFVGVTPAREIWFIEVKDYRVGDGAPSVVDLAQTVGEKVRDSVAIAVAAAREYNPPRRDCVIEIGRTLPDPNCTLRIIIWVEDRGGSVKKQKHDLMLVASEVKKRLRWLTSKVFAVNMATCNGSVPALTVTNLPGAGQP